MQILFWINLDSDLDVTDFEIIFFPIKGTDFHNLLYIIIIIIILFSIIPETIATNMCVYV